MLRVVFSLLWGETCIEMNPQQMVYKIIHETSISMHNKRMNNVSGPFCMALVK